MLKLTTLSCFINENYSTSKNFYNGHTFKSENAFSKTPQKKENGKLSNFAAT